jgi:hypothetical protein
LRCAVSSFSRWRTTSCSMLAISERGAVCMA